MTRNSLSINTASGSYYQGTAPVTFLTAFHAGADIGMEFTAANPSGTTNSLGAGYNTHEVSTQDGLLNKSAGAGFQLAASGSSAAGVDWGYIRNDYAADGLLINVSRDTSSYANNNGGTDAIQPWLALYSGWDNTFDGITGNANVANTSLAPLPGINTITGSRGGSFTDGTDNPFGTSGLKYLGSVMNTSGLSTISYLYSGSTVANQHFTLLIGGANGSAGNYIASVSAYVVPAPAAAWLFGGALMSLAGAHRRKKMLAA